MLNETTKNFLKVMAEYQWPDPKPITYRLYYNADGTPECYSTEELSGKYIEVDAQTFVLRPWNVRVKDQKLIYIEPKTLLQKLSVDPESGTPCHPQDVCIIVPTQTAHKLWNLITNEIN